MFKSSTRQLGLNGTLDLYDFSRPLMADFSVDAALLHVRKVGSPDGLLPLVLALVLGLLRRQRQDLQLVGRQAQAVDVLGGEHDRVVGERLQVEGGEGSLLARDLNR